MSKDEWGGGGGFFQRGGISDLGRALAGDAPRVVPPKPAAQPGGMSGLQFAGNQDVSRLDQNQHAERRGYNEAFKAPGAMQAAAGNRSSFWDTAKEKAKRFPHPPAKNTEKIAVWAKDRAKGFPNPESRTGTFADGLARANKRYDDRVAQAAETPTASPVRKTNLFSETFNNLRKRLNEKYPGTLNRIASTTSAPGSLKDWKH